ncbi:MAG: hypothetical protein QXT45_06840 [Candidatus Bilamarchaeaceae archaeon]
MRTTENVQRRFAQLGRDAPASFEKLRRVLRDLHDKELEGINKKLSRIGDIIEARIKRIEELKKSGAAPEEIARQEAALGRSLDRMARLSARQEMAAGGRAGGAFGPAFVSPTIGRMVSMAGAAAPMIMRATQIPQELLTAINRNTAVVGESYKAIVHQMYAGDASRAVLYSDPRRAESIEREVSRMRAADRASNIGRIVGGGLLAAAGAVALTAALPALLPAIAAGGLGALATGAGATAALGGGAALAGLSAIYRGALPFITGEQQALDIQRRQMAEQRAAAQTMDVDFYRYFLQRSRQRFEVGRIFGFSDVDALATRELFRRALVSESEMPQFLMPFRGFGAARAQQLGFGAANAFLQYGLTRESAVQSLAGLAAVSPAGPGRAADELAQIVSRGVSMGIKDAGLIDAYQQTMTQIVQAMGGRMSVQDLGEDINRFFAAGRFDPARQIQGVVPAAANLGAVLAGTSPLMSSVKTARLMDLIRDPTTGGFNMAELMYFEGLSPMQLAFLNERDPVLRRIQQRLGISDEAMRGRVEQFRQGMLRIQGSLGIGFETVQELTQKVRAGGQLSQGDLRALAAAMGQAQFATQGTPEALAAFAQEVLGAQGVQVRFDESLQLTPDELERIRGKGLPGEIGAAAAATRQRELEIAGERQIDVGIARTIDSNMEAIATRFMNQLDRMSQQLDANVLSESVSGVKTALDELAQAVQEATRNIRNSSAGGAYSPLPNLVNPNPIGVSPATPAAPRPPGR